MQDIDLPLDILERYLGSYVDEFSNLLSCRKFAGGQSNPTYLLKARSGRYVLRRQPFGKLLKSAHAVDREFRVMEALQQSEVPVARTRHLCNDASVIGCLFYVMDFVDGKVFWNPSLPELSAGERTKVYDELNRVLAALHDVDIDAAGLSDYGRPGNYFERQISRWSQQYRATEIEPIPAMDELMHWLPANLPEDDGKVSLIHGDFRIDNLIFDADKHRALALIDWELSTLGHPYADLAYQCMQLRLDTDAAIPGLGDVNRVELGIPDETAYVEQYCQRRGLDGIPDWSFYLVFSFFRLAAILQGVLKRAHDGNASNRESAFAYGALAPTLADNAVELIAHPR